MVHGKLAARRHEKIWGGMQMHSSVHVDSRAVGEESGDESDDAPAPDSSTAVAASTTASSQRGARAIDLEDSDDGGEGSGTAADSDADGRGLDSANGCQYLISC
jgi:hypothetical protein